MRKTDYLIIGAGIAGLSTALHLKSTGRVMVLTKGKLKQANTYWAQGGVSAVMTKEDRFKKHIVDTMEAGMHHNDREAVRQLVEHAPRAIRFLQSIGVKIQKKPALESGHSEARVWHSSDFTGQDILDALVEEVRKTNTIEVLEEADAVELIARHGQCYGAFIRIGEQAGLEPLLAQYTILATGGVGQLFARTSNTRGSAGDGLALAVNAGLELMDMEFIQFHPTALDVYDEDRYFLLSETLRGFGAKVVNEKGENFLAGYDKRAELAPRDIVSRAIYFEQMNGRVYLDLRFLDPKAVKKQFPNIVKRLKHYGFDFQKQPIPITPVAHFLCGGIPTDIFGRTKLPGLFAVGEVACARVHGANRLPSNSLLEGLVFAEAIAKYLQNLKETGPSVDLNAFPDPEAPTLIMEELPQVKAYAKRIGQIMWEKAGIIRTLGGLKEAMKEITEIPARDYRIQHRQIVCYKIIEACLSRPSSLGCHFVAREMM